MRLEQSVKHENHVILYSTCGSTIPECNQSIIIILILSEREHCVMSWIPFHRICLSRSRFEIRSPNLGRERLNSRPHYPPRGRLENAPSDIHIPSGRQAHCTSSGCFASLQCSHLQNRMAPKAAAGGEKPKKQESGKPVAAEGSEKAKKQDVGTEKKRKQPGAEEVLPDPSKLRILCLHGFRTSGKIMAEQVTLANWTPIIDDIAELVFMDAPWPASGKSDVEKRFAGPYFEWYQANEDFTEVYGLDEATAHIANHIALHGPIDGIMGFSQGAVLSAALVGLYEKGMGPEIPNINFVILVGGGRSRAKLLRHAYFDTIMCPSLHMIGEKDFMKENGESLAKAFKDANVIRHPSGHVVPKLGADEGKAYREFLLKQLKFKLAPSEDVEDSKEKSIASLEDQIAL